LKITPYPPIEITVYKLYTTVKFLHTDNFLDGKSTIGQWYWEVGRGPG